MAKTKNKKKNSSTHVNNKRKLENTKKLNPFEVHINKEKMKVLGRISRHSKGLPGVSRNKAIQKRKGTLLQEYKLHNKSNKFVDKRIGERDNHLTEEDRAVARFAAVRAKSHKKKSIFNLADDEVLTHRGQTLNEIEKFDDPRSDDEESYDEMNSSGKLNSDFVEDAHFGGGILSKTSNDGAKSHKDLINQLIAESKKRKAEKQLTKEKTLQLTEQLDTDWKDLIPIVNKSVKTSGERPKPEVDDYDKTIRELKFEARGQPSEPLKPESQIAQEEKEKLEKLESERLSRMKGFIETVAAPKHHGADDLDDDFAYDSGPEIMVSYNEEGILNVAHKPETEITEKDQEDQENHQEDASQSGSSDDEDENTSEDDLSDLKNESGSDTENEDEDNNVKEAQEENSDDEDVDSSKNKQNDLQLKEDPELRQSAGIHKKETQYNDKQLKKIKADLLLRKEMMENARKELPYTFEFPESYEQLKMLFNDQSPEHQSVIIERIIKCTHPSLNEGNKEKLNVLFAYLLQYIDDIAAMDDIKVCFNIFSNLIPQLFDLAQLNKENAHSCVLEVIKEKHLEYRKNPKKYPGIEVLLFLKIISCLFPTSDFRHQIVTPCLVFIDQMLQKCRPKTKKDIAYGLFLITLIVEYTSLSKRYLPAVINYLGGILHMAIPKSGIKLVKVIPPFRSTSSALVLYKNCSSLNMSLRLESTDLTSTEISEDFKIRSLFISLKLILEFKDNFKELPCRKEILQPILGYLEQIPICNYPEYVKNEIESLINSIQKFMNDIKLDFIVMEAKRPKALRLYTPNIEKVYDTKKRRITSREVAEREKLIHKLKREHKGALREIRRDRAFLGRIKINQKIQSDKERHEKVKKIFAEASIQQGELNSLKRKKK